MTTQSVSQETTDIVLTKTDTDTWTKLTFKHSTQFRYSVCMNVHWWMEVFVVSVVSVGDIVTFLYLLCLFHRRVLVHKEGKGDQGNTEQGWNKGPMLEKSVPSICIQESLEHCWKHNLRDRRPLHHRSYGGFHAPINKAYWLEFIFAVWLFPSHPQSITIPSSLCLLLAQLRQKFYAPKGQGYWSLIWTVHLISLRSRPNH